MGTPALAVGTPGGPAAEPIHHSQRPGLVLAGPAGSGRTRGVVEHFAERLAAGRAPEQLAVVVPDRARAARLTPRLEACLPSGWGELLVLTPVELARRVLGATPGRAHLADAVRSTGERLVLLGERIDELQLDRHDFAGNAGALLADLVRRIDACKAEGIDPRRFAEWAAALDDDASLRAAVREGRRPLDGAREREFAALFAAHDRLLREAGLLDAGDALGLAARFAAQRRATGLAVVEVLVDDAHELSLAAARLCEAVALDGLTVAGDPAAPEAGLRRFVTLGLDVAPGATPGTRMIALERRRPAPSERFWLASSERAQAQAVAAHVERLLRTPDAVAPDRIAVLVPAVGRDGAQIAVALEERSIPHRVVGAAAFFARPEIRDVLAWLRWLTDPGDAPAAVRALSRAPIELRSVDIARVTQIARRRKLDMVAALAAATESPQVPPEARERIRGCLTLYRSAAARVDAGRPDLFVHRLIERLGMRRRHLFAAQGEVVEQLRALARLGELAAAHADRHPLASPRDFARSLAAIAEQGSLTPDAVSAGEDAAGADLGVDRAEVRILDLAAAATVQVSHVIVTGVNRNLALAVPPALPAELAGPALPGPAAPTPADRLVAAVERADTEAVLCAVSTAGGPHEALERRREAAGAELEPQAEELYAPGESLAAAYGLLRDELLDATPRAAGRLAELRFDTDLDISHAVVRYLELLKVGALLARPEGQSVEEALADLNLRLGHAVTAEQREILATSPLDRYLLDADRDARGRSQLRAARDEPSLARFLPLRGEGVLLSASDIDLYRSCPLKYKFARVFRIPQEPTLHQRFGITMHQVLERYHQAAAARGPAPEAPGETPDLLGLLEVAWRRQGFGDSDEERQLRHKAEAALGRYAASARSEDREPVWFERPFSFRIGAHLIRGRVDRVDRLADGGYELIDYKTGRPRAVETLSEDVQLSLYTVAAREAWGLEPSRGAYVYLLDDARVAVTGDADREAWIRAACEEVAAGIQAQEFEPTPSPTACGFCDYRLACPVAER